MSSAGLVPEMLVPFDGSQAAERVLRSACQTARRDGGSLYVLCVALLPADETAEPSDIVETTVLHALLRAQQVCAEEGVACMFKLSYARNLADAILAEARRGDATLIAMSLNEHERGESALMSETVQEVLAAAPCTVLLTDPSPE
jgi:nucleotide-binding universal stress UspA family protein